VNPQPVDSLISELAQSDRVPAPTEVRQIIRRMASAPFDRRLIPVPTRLRTLTYHGRTLGPRSDSLAYHLAKRVMDERQWAMGTTAVQYLADLRRAVRHASARLAVYERRGGVIAVTLTPTSAAVSASRRTPESLPSLLVVFSADRGIILTGYQVSAPDRTGVPEDARWLT
jgi:hypothetical protein